MGLRDQLGSSSEAPAHPQGIAFIDSCKTSEMKEDEDKGVKGIKKEKIESNL